MRIKSLFLCLFALGVLQARASDSTTVCSKVSDPLKAVRALMFDHGGSYLVESDYFQLGRHVVYYKDVEAVFVDPKQQLRVTYWVRVVSNGKTLSFETKNEQHATDAVNAIKCLSNNFK